MVQSSQSHLPLTTPNVPLTMSSREIAELVNSRHDKVKQSIERLAERGVIQLPPMGDVKNHQGQTVKEYRIGKRDSFVIVAQLCPEFTACLVDRWQELEAQVSRSDFLSDDPKALSRLLIETLNKQIAAHKKHIAKLDMVLAALYCFMVPEEKHRFTGQTAYLLAQDKRMKARAVGCKN